MPPNIVDPPLGEVPDSVVVKSAVNVTNGSQPTKVTVVNNIQENKSSLICLSTMNLLAHILIGAVVTISFVYALRNGLPIGATPIHIILCVLGYQLLMAEAILSLAPENGWTHKLNMVDKRRAHWIMHLLGSILAFAGSFIIILNKNVHWNTLHGQFGLVAMVFTSVSLFNGVASMYPAKVPMPTTTKICHILCGTVGFVTASVSLIYGFDKNAFRNWLTPELADTFIAFTVVFTFIIIVPPFVTMYRKSSNMLSR